jgi:hypothetical protein
MSHPLLAKGFSWFAMPLAARRRPAIQLDRARRDGEVIDQDAIGP